MLGDRMKRATLHLAFIVFFSTIAFAQDPANFHIIYGNRDGSPIDVRPGDTIEVQCWGATDPTPGNPDTVTFMHNPLMSNDSIIVERLIGTFPDTFVGRWDDRSFLRLDTHENDPAIPPGFTSQSMLGFAYLFDPPDLPNWFFTGGDTVLICTFRMRVTTDARYNGRTVCPFSSGHDPANQGLLWGMPDGIRSVIPMETFGCLHFVFSQSTPDEPEKPSDFSLAQNYPNPFNPETTIEFSIPREADVSLIVYDLLGRHIKVLIGERLEAGRFIAHWDGRNDAGLDAPSGIYFYRMFTSAFTKTNKMILLR
jgi:hypothetical protein